MKKISIEEFVLNPYKIIAKDWMLVTAGTKENDYNTMTASWGHLGSIWGSGGGKPTAVIYIRPQRFTKQFVDKEAYFSLTFFSEDYRNALNYLGSHSGKDEDKVSKTNLTPIYDNRAVYFKEAKLTLICRKLFAQEIKEASFIDKEIVDKNYPLKDFHTMYIGEIEEILVNE